MGGKGPPPKRDPPKRDPPKKDPPKGDDEQASGASLSQIEALMQQQLRQVQETQRQMQEQMQRQMAQQMQELRKEMHVQKRASTRPEAEFTRPEAELTALADVAVCSRPPPSSSTQSSASSTTLCIPGPAEEERVERTHVTRSDRKRQKLASCYQAELAQLAAEEKSRDTEARIHTAGRKAYLQAVLRALDDE